MRLAGAILIASTIALSAPTVIAPLSSPDAAQAQTSAGAIVVAEAKGKGKAPPKKDPPKGGGGGNYASMPLGERVGIQFDLAWTGHFTGLINGEFDAKAIAAVRAFQKSNGFREPGTLAPPERERLASQAKTRQDRSGWKMVDDKVTGAQVGVPTAQMPNISQVRSGTRWASAQGQMLAETFRIREPGTTLASVFEQQKKEPPNRKLEVSFMKDDYFFLSGMQGLKKFFVRAHIRDLEVRGLTVAWDQATEGVMDHVGVAMQSAFAPFPGTGLADIMGPSRRKIDYGTGIVVTTGGHILTDRRLVEGCNVIQVSPLGDANKIAEDEAAGVALIRVFGVPDLAPAALVHEGARGADLTLVGIADPQSQAGGRAITTVSVKLNGDAIQPPPQLGFSGAAALDSQGRLFGMVALKTAVQAGTGTPQLPQAGVVPVDTIRRFLDGQYVTPATGKSGVDAAKASVVRVICVRR
jgi:hypothetical protein